MLVSQATEANNTLFAITYWYDLVTLQLDEAVKKLLSLGPEARNSFYKMWFDCSRGDMPRVISMYLFFSLQSIFFLGKINEKNETLLFALYISGETCVYVCVYVCIHGCVCMYVRMCMHACRICIYESCVCCVKHDHFRWNEANHRILLTPLDWSNLS
jgi:hypothetical protein